MTNTPKSFPDLYRRWHAVLTLSKRPGEPEDEFDARVAAAADVREVLDQEMANTPATRPSDIAIKLQAVRAFAGEFGFDEGPIVPVLDSAIADLERFGAPIDERDAALVAAEAEIGRAYEELKTAPDSDAGREVIWKRVDAAEDAIAAAIPTSMAGAAVKLRRILHSADINNGNLSTRDAPSLVRVLEFVSSFYGKASPELVTLCDRFRAMVEAYNGSDSGSDAAFNELQAVREQIDAFEACGAADIAAKLRVAEFNASDNFAELAAQGDLLGRALAQALADLDRLARRGC